MTYNRHKSASPPTRPVVYPCCCNLLAKVVSPGGSPPELPRKRSTCTRPVLPIPDPQKGTWVKTNRNKRTDAFVLQTQPAACGTWAERVAPRHESSAARRAEGSRGHVLSQLYTLRRKSVDVGGPAGKPNMEIHHPERETRYRQDVIISNSLIKGSISVSWDGNKANAFGLAWWCCYRSSLHHRCPGRPPSSAQSWAFGGTHSRCRYPPPAGAERQRDAQIQQIFKEKIPTVNQSRLMGVI